MEERSLVQQRDIFHRRRLLHRLQKRVNIGQILIGNYLGGIRRHLPGWLANIALDGGERDRLGTKPRPGAQSALRLAPMTLITAEIFEKLSAVLSISRGRLRQ